MKNQITPLKSLLHYRQTKGRCQLQRYMPSSGMPMLKVAICPSAACIIERRQSATAIAKCAARPSTDGAPRSSAYASKHQAESGKSVKASAIVHRPSFKAKALVEASRTGLNCVRPLPYVAH